MRVEEARLLQKLSSYHHSIRIFRKDIEEYVDSKINQPPMDGYIHVYIRDLIEHLGVAKSDIPPEYVADLYTYLGFSATIKNNGTYILIEWGWDD